MKNFILGLMLVFTLVFGFMGTQTATPVSAAGCTFSPKTPYAATYGQNIASGNFYCNTGGYHTYKICINQSGTNVTCNWVKTTTYSVNMYVGCYLNGTSGPAAFRTSMYIYEGNDYFVGSALGGTAYLNRCI